MVDSGVLHGHDNTKFSVIVSRKYMAARRENFDIDPVNRLR